MGRRSAVMSRSWPPCWMTTSARSAARGACFDRAAALAEIPRERAQVEIVSSDYDIALLAPTLAQVRYRSWYVIDGVRQREVLRSSLWRLRDGAWRVVFHQGTPAAP